MYRKKYKPLYRPGFGNYGKSLEQTAFEVINRMKKRKYSKVNFFQGYRYPALDALYFNLLINGRKFDIRSASKRDITEHYHKHLKEIVEQNRNLIGMCTGKPGLGKSLITMAVAIELMENHEEFNNNLPENERKHPTVDFSFNFGQSQKKLKRMKPGDVLIQDEIHDQSGEMSRTTLVALKNIVKSFRWTQKSFIINNPDYVYLPALNLIISPIGQSERFFETNKPDDMNTRIWIRYIDDTQQHKAPIYLGYAVINVAKAFETIYKQYVSLKHNDYNRLEKHGGMDSAKMDEEDFQRDVEELERVALENGWDGKSKTELGRYLQMTDIAFDTARKKYLLTEVYKRQKQREKEQSKQMMKEAEKRIEKENEMINKMISSVQNQVVTFDAPDDVFFDKLKVEKTNYENRTRDIEIYKQYCKGEKVVILASTYGISEAAINQAINKVMGYINDSRGDLYEKYKTEQLKQSKSYKDVIHDGAPGRPDIYAITPENELHVFSCKAVDFIKRNNRSLGIREFTAELDFAREQKNSGKYKDVKLFYYICEVRSKLEESGEISLTNPLVSMNILLDKTNNKLIVKKTIY